mmetsp:Transcript_4302/g.7074  ORF Transcript_4302/g.7074 Transcript_4302/m.7074 type:complete len:89 (-) Transcript_4302:23-289(-)
MNWKITLIGAILIGIATCFEIIAILTFHQRDSYYYYGWALTLDFVVAVNSIMQFVYIVYIIYQLYILMKAGKSNSQYEEVDESSILVE